MKRLELVLICLLLWAGSSYAGEALITKVRGSSLTIDTGAETGLIQGMIVTIIRPPGEAVIHPITGENLGAPEVEIGSGEISKIANRAANVRIGPGLLLPVKPGDIVRFVTPDEEMIMDQERSVARQEKNAEDHQGFRKEISQLTRSIRNVQGRIGGIEKAIKRVERVEEGFKVQLRGINTDINTMKDDIKNLKESVALMGTIPIDGLGEDGQPLGGLNLESEEDVEALKQVVRDVLDEEQITTDLPPLGAEELAVPSADEDLGEGEMGEPAEDEDESFFGSFIFFGILAGIGFLAVLAFLYLRLMDGSEEDAEDEEDEEIEEDDDNLDMDDDLDMEVEEEDDIVVEETS
ncbi:MAG: hypothetical protein VX293_09695 [Candidatus Latescibacterota bacterium]|nr:hypothetical protein [Candidatus Latescibacterota bacterium]